MGQWKSTAGPRQTKAVEKAILELSRHGQSHVELYGVIGQPETESRSTYWSPLSPTRQDAFDALEDVGEKYAWTITRDNHHAIVEDLEAAKAALAPLPVSDNRHTPEEEAERKQRAAERDAEHHARQNKSEEIAEEIARRRPPWADAAIIAEMEIDDCDSMTDYFATKTDRKVLIGWRRGKREDFRQLRRAAAQFCETAHLGPGKERIELRAYDAKDNRFLPWSMLGQGDEAPHFDNEQDADAWIEAHPAPDGYAIEKNVESIEHRENWSMGAGNYLKAARRYGTGWTVRSHDAAATYWITADLEIALPAEPANAPKSATRKGSRAKPTPVAEATVTENDEKDGIEIRFPDRPPQETLDALKANGWRWSRFGKCWYARRTPEARTFAENIAGQARAAA